MRVCLARFTLACDFLEYLRHFRVDVVKFGVLKKVIQFIRARMSESLVQALNIYSSEEALLEIVPVDERVPETPLETYSFPRFLMD